MPDSAWQAEQEGWRKREDAATRMFRNCVWIGVVHRSTSVRHLRQQRLANGKGTVGEHVTACWTCCTLKVKPEEQLQF